MIHPIRSIKARNQAWALGHFEATGYSRKLKQFKGIHQGETCFIIGNGPSLQAEDLEMLCQKRIPTFGFNRIYLMFENTNWRPTYYVSQDEKMLGNCKEIVDKLDLPYKFIPLFHKYYHNINIQNAYYFKLKLGDDGKTFFSEDISKFIGDSTTVACSAIQIAVYMGFKKIYLIGVDHSFSTYKNDKGEIINDETVRDYFSDEYFKDKAQLYVPDLDASARAFLVMREYCDKHDIEIYNATRGGRLEVFQRVDLDNVLNDL